MDCMPSVLQSGFGCDCDPSVGYDYFETSLVMIMKLWISLGIS